MIIIESVFCKIDNTYFTQEQLDKVFIKDNDIYYELWPENIFSNLNDLTAGNYIVKIKKGL